MHTKRAVPEQNQNFMSDNSKNLKEVIKTTPMSNTSQSKPNSQLYNNSNTSHIQSILNSPINNASPSNNYVTHCTNKPNDQNGNFQNRSLISNVQENPKSITSRRNSKSSLINNFFKFI